MPRQRMSNSEFTRYYTRLLSEPLAEMGFDEETDGYFLRARARFQDVIGCSLSEAEGCLFCVIIGVRVPSVAEKMRPILRTKQPAPMVSKYLNPKAMGTQKWYFFGSNRPLEAALEEMIQDFRAAGLPWLAQFQSLEDVVAAYYDERFRERHVPRAPVPVQWTTYGLLLHALGREDEAAEWFEKAKEELRKPIFTDGQRFYNEQRPGTRRMAQPPQERKLLELLESGALLQTPASGEA